MTPEEFIVALQQAYANGGWLLLSSAFLSGIVGVYKSPVVQGLVPDKMRWDAWPGWVRWLVVFGTSYAGGALSAASGHAGWPTVVWGGAVAAFGAMGMHESKQALMPTPKTIRLPPNQPAFLNREPPAL
jgi:hypothetical protein